jgi:hypothetical protein
VTVSADHAVFAAKGGAKRFAAGKTLKRVEFTSGRLSQIRDPRKSAAFAGHDQV